MAKKLARLFPRHSVRTSVSGLFSDLWNLHDGHSDLLAHINDLVAEASSADFRAAVAGSAGGILQKGNVIPIQGLIVSSGAEFLRFFGVEATGIDEIREALAEAVASDSQTITLAINSPGGTTMGLQATADAIYHARDNKKVVAHATGMAASAAYWLGSQAEEFTAEDGALVGSIGVYLAVTDDSRMFEKAGVKTHVLRSGKFKGVGAGDAITKDQLAALQSLVDKQAEAFFDAVERGRDIDATKVEKFEGQTFLAAEAVERKLIDTVSTGPIVQPASQDDAEKEDRMSNEAFRAELAELSAQLTELRESQSTLQAENAKLAAEAEISRRALADARKASIAAVIEGHAKAGRVTPAMRSHIEKQAAAYGDDVEGLDAFLSTLPVQVSPEAHGAGEAGRAESYSDEEKAVAKLFGLSAKDVRWGTKVVALSGDQYVMADGSLQDSKEDN